MSSNQNQHGLRVSRRYSKPGIHPFDEVEWRHTTAEISGDSGVVFRQENVEVPSFWTDQATKVVANKYFRGHLHTPEREHSARQLIGRVAGTISDWGQQDGYFATEEDAESFRGELTYLLLHQCMAFNSPVWFNVGLPDNPRPQCSACFINSVDDDMDSIMSLAATEARLFKGGSGAGSNLSRIRSSRERLSGGGIASGPVSFMKGYDAFAGVIKSGGKTRRAAKMVILNIDHPDILEFIRCKSDEEQKAWALIEAGYDSGFNVPGGAYDSVFFQNANHSVRVTDAFMEAAGDDRTFLTREVLSGAPADELSAKAALHEIARCTHICGDPGMQFDTTINRWHTCKETDRIYASNPCSEYMFLDDTACNLASINLMKFLREDDSFDIEGYIHACEITLTAQEIIVSRASYPTPAIEKNSHDFRPLGLGYANLGSLVMALGLAYDSDAARTLAAALTAIMTGAAYHQSARMAAAKGPFTGYARNRESMLEVMRMHRNAVDDVKSIPAAVELLDAARRVWRSAVELGEIHGYRNSQATVLAPTGTIAFLMDCDTTGIEPEIALIKYKMLVGGGTMKIVNRIVPRALKRLGYDEQEIEEIVAHIADQGHIEGAPGFRTEHLPVFDCAFRAEGSRRSIHHLGHVRMMAAVQPFISGAISKTVNVPQEATVEEIAATYYEAWRLGLKAIAIYRDGSKRTQPLSTGRKKEQSGSAAQSSDPEPAALRTVDDVPAPYRRRLSDERESVTHKFSISGHEGYIHVGLFPDGSPGEIFVTMSKEGSTISGLMDAFATSISLALQYGVPLDVLVRKFSHTRYEPNGWTTHPQITFAKSITDYIFRWLAIRFPRWAPGYGEEQPAEAEMYLAPAPADVAETAQRQVERRNLPGMQDDAPPCHGCGMIMVRAGACYRCTNCGESSGCG